MNRECAFVIKDFRGCCGAVSLSCVGDCFAGWRAAATARGGAAWSLSFSLGANTS